MSRSLARRVRVTLASCATLAVSLASAASMAQAPATQQASTRPAVDPTTQPILPDRTQLAFPGAEGYGRYALGGRGGSVYIVTNLDDSGPGSLREGLKTPGPVTIVFAVSGTIELQSGLQVSRPFVTIAGQTAPGDGIALKNYELYVRADDVIVRHLRVRPGNARPGERDAITVRNCRNVIIDHCSGSWAVDEVLSTTGARLVTVQWCFITEALHSAGHHKGNHGFGGLIQGQGITYHHNLYAHNRSRNPRPASGRIDFRNNVVYDWNDMAGYAENNKQKMNFVNNYAKPGPSTTKHREVMFHTGDQGTSVYFSGNVVEGAADGTDPLAPINLRKNVVVASEPFEMIPVPTFTAAEALQRVLAGAGATLPKRDAVDARIVEQFRTGTGRQIDSVDEVGGWPELRSGPAPADADADGMPDAWETQHGLDPQNPDDRNADPDGDGYTNLEERLNGTNPHAKD
jgi:pectate lyase